jgi:aminoglycoside phosphotransferase (APT) family kinase protein
MTTGTTGTMHADEVPTNTILVQRLLAAQFPQWADLPIAPVPSSGTDNALYRLGADMVVRLPRIHWAIDQVEKEQRWLPWLAPQLPLAIPEPLAIGEPAAGYPWRWSVYRWLPGEMVTRENTPDQHQLAIDLAAFITALQRIDASDGPPPGDHNVGRGVPLTRRDDYTRAAIASMRALPDMPDADAATAAWEAALRVPAWDGPPAWLHGDLQAGNLLVQDGRLSAVIDFGCLGVGDPACELSVAWNLFDTEARAVFRAALDVDDATWARGRGWALSVALVALPYYHITNLRLAGMSRYAIGEVLAEHGGGEPAHG